MLELTPRLHPCRKSIRRDGNVDVEIGMYATAAGFATIIFDTNDLEVSAAPPLTTGREMIESP